MTFATCRGCHRDFTSGWGAQSPIAPRLCRDCYHRELAFHDYGHAAGVACLREYIGGAA